MPDAAPPPQDTPNAAPQNQLWWILVGLFIVVLTLVVVLGGRPLYQYFKANQATEAAKSLELDMEAERWEAASQLAKEAMVDYPDQPPVLRSVARLLTSYYGDHEGAVSLLRRFIDSPEATAKDRTELAAALLKSGLAEEAQKAYDKLPPEEKAESAAMELYANLLLETGREAEAVTLLREALKKAPDDPRAQLRLAVLDLQLTAMQQSRSTVAATLWTLARRKDKVGLEAMGQINVLPELTATESAELVALMEAHPATEPRHRFALLTTYLKLHPLERDRVIAEQVKAHQGKAISAQYDLLRWLGIQGEHERILQSLPRQLALKDPDIFRVYVDALASGQQWSQIMALMKERIPLEKSSASLILAKASSELPAESPQARQYLRNVFANAGPVDTGLVIQAATVAEEKGHTDLAIEGFTRAMQSKARLRVPMLENILRLQRRAKDVQGIISALKALLVERPSHRDYGAQLAYYRLLTGTELELAWNQAGVASEVVPLPVLKVLTSMSQGQTQPDVTEVKTLTSLEQLDAGVRAVVCGLLALGKEDVTAYHLASKVPSSLLLPEELHFLQIALQP